MDNTLIKEIKFFPWKGQNNEVIEGKKTKINLFSDRLEFIIKFTQEVTIELIKDGEPIGDPKETTNDCEEYGCITKDSIIALTKYIETDYDKKNGDPFNIQKLDIAYGATIFTFTFENEEDKHILYEELYKWKFNK